MFYLTNIVLDTGIIIEYIDEEGEYHEQANMVFTAILTGKLKGILPHPTLVETYYVVARIYRKLNIEEPETIALKLIEWLYKLPTITMADMNLNLALETGKIKLYYKLALTDCYILATSKIYNGIALFRKLEREMLENIDELKKSYQIMFLEDYK